MLVVVRAESGVNAEVFTNILAGAFWSPPLDVRVSSSTDGDGLAAILLASEVNDVLVVVRAEAGINAEVFANMNAGAFWSPPLDVRVSSSTDGDGLAAILLASEVNDVLVVVRAEAGINAEVFANMNAGAFWSPPLDVRVSSSTDGDGLAAILLASEVNDVLVVVRAEAGVNAEVSANILTVSTSTDEGRFVIVLLANEVNNVLVIVRAEAGVNAEVFANILGPPPDIRVSSSTDEGRFATILLASEVNDVLVIVRAEAGANAEAGTNTEADSGILGSKSTPSRDVQLFHTVDKYDSYSDSAEPFAICPSTNGTANTFV